ncbi:histidine kinase [Chitinophaga horti]|uniref:Histidine kinase n=1 Tax=Chitinophaga horti TaxID=2920382 RepID=A0ABY6J713_9BACT|nr:histidine kinase [Chitinophaga horti]UYQ95460.1 histidine kinase [Chitinophaga horti]
MRRKVSTFLVLLTVWMLLQYTMGLLNMNLPITQLKLLHLHIQQGLFGLLHFFIFYTAIQWPFRRYLQNRHLPGLALRLLLLHIAATLIKYGLSVTFLNEEVMRMGFRNGLPVYRTFSNYAISCTWTHAWIFCAALAYVLFRSWLDADKRRLQLLHQKEEAEMGLLKTQLNVHFLMNSLNSLYSLALVRSPQAVTATRTLSHLLQYMTDQPPAAAYRGKLEDELQYLRDFIAMHRLRTGCDSCVQLDVTGDVSSFHIAPLLLVPFVENAFKHGVTNQPEKPIRITITCQDTLFTFSVHNFNMPKRKDKTGGIGLENVRRRLELVYPGQYQLDIAASEQAYQVTLQINW